MSKTNRIYASATECGRYQLTWTWPHELADFPLIITHSGSLKLPVSPLSKNELNEWVRRTVREGCKVRRDLNGRSTFAFFEHLRYSDVATTLAEQDGVLTTTVENASAVILHK